MSALYKPVLDAVADVVAATLTSATVVVRKRPFFSSNHGDAAPLVVVSPDKERLAKMQQNGGAWWDYPVYVTLILAQGGDLEKDSDLSAMLTARADLKTALWRPTLSGVAQVFDADYDPHPAFDLSGLDNLHDVSVQLFTFRTSESRP